MVQITINLDEKQDKIVRKHQFENHITSKEKAILDIIEKEY